VKHLHSSRTWIGTTGERSRRVTTLTFVLPRAGRVYFTVTELSPECVLIARFSVQGKAGLNRIRFASRVGKRQLDAGTYRISARTSSGSIVQRVLLVVVDGSAPTGPELAAARASNACSLAARTIASSANGDEGTASGGASFVAPKGLRGEFAPGSRSTGTPAGPTPELPTGGVLVSAVEETARALQPALLILLAAAIVLLAIASLPKVAVPDARLNDALARHRLEIAAIGAAALVAFAITLFLTLL
jgi:hypothetical protein